MSVQVEKLEHNMAKLTIEVEASKFDAAMKKAYNKKKGSFNLPGFRKGTMCQRTQLNRLIQKTTHSNSQVWMQMEMRLVNRTLEQDVWQQVSGHGNVKMRFSSITNVLQH